jgi:hypothetical protein
MLQILKFTVRKALLQAKFLIGRVLFFPPAWFIITEGEKISD